MLANFNGDFSGEAGSRFVFALPRSSKKRGNRKRNNTGEEDDADIKFPVKKKKILKKLSKKRESLKCRRCGIKSKEWEKCHKNSKEIDNSDTKY